MFGPGTIYQFKLTLRGSEPEIWRRAVVPAECTLYALHWVILYAFCWFTDRPHELLLGARRFALKGHEAPGPHKDEEQAVLHEVLDGPGTTLRYRCTTGDRWEVDVTLEAEQAPVPFGHYPCVIEGANSEPPEGVGGIARYNELVEAHTRDLASWEALLTDRDRAGWLKELWFEPSYFDMGDINGCLGLIFPDLRHPWIRVPSGAELFKDALEDPASFGPSGVRH